MLPRQPLPFIALLVVLAAPAFASTTGVPAPFNSTTPDCLALCPLGDVPFAVVVRDLASNPVAGSTVVLDFSNCPGAHLCGALPQDTYTLDPVARTLRGSTDATGSVVWAARVGGVGGTGSVRLYADGVLLNEYALASPDQNGDGVVLGSPDADGTTFAAKLGTTDPTADFDCNGIVDSTDEFFYYAHISHSCFGIVDPAKKSTWGVIKLLYR